MKAIVCTQYGPPDGLQPGEAGNVMNEKNEANT